MIQSVVHHPEYGDYSASAINIVSTSRVGLFLEGSPGRRSVENYIADKYHRVHGADLKEFLPVLVSIYQDDVPAGAFGLRPGHYRPMFLEQYLDSPIEQQVASISRRPVDRCSLMEVGNLVASRNGYGSVLLITVAMSLAEAGYEWMVFTVTEQLERMMKRLCFTPHYLASANPDRLTSDKAIWGTYYENNPKVMVGSLKEVVAIVRNNSKLQLIAQQYQSQILEIAHTLSDYRRLTGK